MGKWSICFAEVDHLLFAVAKLSQNPIVLTVFGFGLEREQNPRIE